MGRRYGVSLKDENEMAQAKFFIFKILKSITSQKIWGGGGEPQWHDALGHGQTFYKLAVKTAVSFY